MIWHPRDDERYMHAFSFAKQYLEKDSPRSVMRMAYIFRWVSCMGLYYVDGEEDDYRVPECYVDLHYTG
jgi:hypothetical protein